MWQLKQHSGAMVGQVQAQDVILNIERIRFRHHSSVTPAHSHASAEPAQHQRTSQAAALPIVRAVGVPRQPVVELRQMVSGDIKLEAVQGQLSTDAGGLHAGGFETQIIGAWHHGAM